MTELALPLLVNALTSLPDRIVLVLDDYHVITSADVHQSMEFLIDHLPHGRYRWRWPGAAFLRWGWRGCGRALSCWRYGRRTCG